MTSLVKRISSRERQKIKPNDFALFLTLHDSRTTLHEII